MQIVVDCIRSILQLKNTQTQQNQRNELTQRTTKLCTTTKTHGGHIYSLAQHMQYAKPSSTNGSALHTNDGWRSWSLALLAFVAETGKPPPSPLVVDVVVVVVELCQGFYAKRLARPQCFVAHVANTIIMFYAWLMVDSKASQPVTLHHTVYIVQQKASGGSRMCRRTRTSKTTATTTAAAAAVTATCRNGYKNHAHDTRSKQLFACRRRRRSRLSASGPIGLNLNHKFYRRVCA